VPDWLNNALHVDEQLALSVVLTRLAIALILGAVVSAVYRLTHGRTASEPAALSATLVLLTVIIAMVTLAIGNSIARAFSLVGALAIVRFRTVVEDTRDTAFVIFAVAVGLAVGAGATIIPLVGIPFTAIAALIFRPRQAPRQPVVDARLRVRVPLASSAPAAVEAILSAHAEQLRLLEVSTARQGAALDLSYQIRLSPQHAPLELVGQLNRCEGVQEVEFRQE
jgi:uncharacterized membrane protein YhiD involved in acid resistance